jgi:hypothetical protein
MREKREGKLASITKTSDVYHRDCSTCAGGQLGLVMGMKNGYSALTSTDGRL